MLLLGCSTHQVNTNLQKKIRIPERYTSIGGVSSDRRNVSFWYETFGDAHLSTLIQTAFERNYDISRSIARIKAARAAAGISGVAGYPRLSLEAEAGEQFLNSETEESLQAGTILSWEIDLFDKLENAARSDALEVRARQEDLEALKLSLGSEVAGAYFGALAAYQNLALLRKQVQLDRHYLKLVTLRFEQGIATKVEVLQQKEKLAESKSLIPSALAAMQRHENRLDLLLGKAPDGLSRISQKNSLLEVAMPSGIGVPSKLLLSRPDLRAQLSRLIAADAEIAVAVADRLPSLTLGAGIYYTKNSSYSGPLGELGASLLQPLLEWGARKAEVERNKALYEEQLSAFGSLYLQAIEEVETALYSEGQQREYLKRLEARRVILKQTVGEAQAEYEQGISDYLAVLTARKALHEAERSLIAAKYDLVLYRIALHRALGSGEKLKKERV
ncbi:MAG: TolC family protein [Sulfurimonas sp.]